MPTEGMRQGNVRRREQLLWRVGQGSRPLEYDLDQRSVRKALNHWPVGPMILRRKGSSEASCGDRGGERFLSRPAPE